VVADGDKDLNDSPGPGYLCLRLAQDSTGQDVDTDHAPSCMGCLGHARTIPVWPDLPSSSTCWLPCSRLYLSITRHVHIGFSCTHHTHKFTKKTEIINTCSFNCTSSIYKILISNSLYFSYNNKKKNFQIYEFRSVRYFIFLLLIYSL
jgi:hypothetical protein